MITGKGIFTWDGTERRTDRYGSFTLDSSNYDSDANFPDAMWSLDVSLNSLRGKRVKITVEVMEARDSGHIGDMYRGIYPSRPDVGEVIDLGIGEFFIDPTPWSASMYSVGVKPSDGRSNDWFDPKKLYRLHDQTVFVTISETTEEPKAFETGEVSDDTTIMTFPEEDGTTSMQYKGKNFSVWQ